MRRRKVCILFCSNHYAHDGKCQNNDSCYHPYLHNTKGKSNFSVSLLKFLCKKTSTTFDKQEDKYRMERVNNAELLLCTYQQVNNEWGNEFHLRGINISEQCVYMEIITINKVKSDLAGARSILKQQPRKDRSDKKKGKDILTLFLTATPSHNTLYLVNHIIPYALHTSFTFLIIHFTLIQVHNNFSFLSLYGVRYV